MGWHWSDNPERYKPIRCAVCHKCWLDTKHMQCVYGGPFDGYLLPDGTVEKISHDQ